MEKIPEELPEIGVVWLVIEPQRATQVQVGGELGYETQEEEDAWMLQRQLRCLNLKNATKALSTHTFLKTHFWGLKKLPSTH